VKLYRQPGNTPEFGCHSATRSVRMVTRPGGKLVLFALIALGGLASSCGRSPQAKEARFLSRGDAAMKKKNYSRAVLEFLNAVRIMPRDAEAYYQLGKADLAAGALKQSVIALRKATELNPRHVGAQLTLASLMAASRDPRALGEAQARLTSVAGLAPENPDLLDVLALVRFRLGKAEKAEEDLQQELEKLPAHLQTSMDLAKIKLARQDLAGAEQVLQNAVKADPKSAAAALVLGRFYLLSGKQEQGQAEVRRALQLDPKNGPALMTLAQNQFNTGHADEAERTYRQISQLPEKDYKPLHAAFLFKTNQRQAAIAEFEELARQAPDDRAARTRLVAAYFTAGRTADAERTLKAALLKNPKDTEALLQRSRLFMVSGKYNDAESDLRQVLHFQPDSADAHYYLSKGYQARSASINQRQELTEALRFNPNLLAARVELAQLLIASNDAVAALKITNDTPEAQRKTIPAIGARNWALLATGDNAAAREGIDAGLALARAPELLLQDGALKLAGKDPVGAQASFDEALKSIPESVPAWEFLGRAYAARKQPEKALDRLREATLARPHSATLQLLLGRWLMEAGRTFEARAAFEAAKKADSKSVAPDMALAQLEMTQGNTEPSRQHLAAVLAVQPQNTAARVLLGEIAKKTGDRTEAIAQYRAVVELDHSSVVALNDLAFMLSKDDPDEALKYAQQAGELAPDNPAVQDTLGWVYYRKGIYNSAVGYLKTAVEKSGTPSRKYHLGMAYLKTGNQDLGLRMVKAALEADPTLAASQGW
jgi:putative PEP-CTERM system TPR-repeat lipoprotein